MGDVTPKVEDCTTPEDDDCDGTPNEHCGVWSYAFAVPTSGGSNEAYGLAVTTAGHVMVGGAAHGKLAAAGDAGVLDDAGDGAFTVELDSPAHPTSTRYGGGNSALTAVALDGSGGALLGGVVFNNQTVSLPLLAAPLKNTSTSYEWDMLVARLQGGTGVWGVVFDSMPSGENAQSNAVAFGANATAYVAGQFQGTLDLPDGGPDGGYVAKNNGALVLKVAAGSGAVEWSADIGESAAAYTVALGTGGAVLVGGAYSDGTLKLGSKTLPGSGQPSGMLIELDDNSGQPLRARGYPTTGAPATVRVDSIAVDNKAGEVVVAGRFAGTVDFGAAAVDLVADAGTPGGGPGCAPTAPMGVSDVFVARLRIADLSCRWVKTFGNGSGLDGPGHSSSGFTVRGQDFGPQVAVDPTGAALVAANYGTTLPVGPWSLTAPGTYAIALLKLDAQGNLVWVRSFGGAYTYATAIGVDGTGDVYLAGQFTDKLQIEPSHVLVSPALTGHEAVFVARIAH
jgi:hypothetical protein